MSAMTALSRQSRVKKLAFRRKPTRVRLGRVVAARAVAMLPFAELSLPLVREPIDRGHCPAGSRTASLSEYRSFAGPQPDFCIAPPAAEALPP